MPVGELRDLLERHARPDLATVIDGVRVCKFGPGTAPESSMSGTVLAVIAQGGKRLRWVTGSMTTASASISSSRSTSR